MAKKKASQKSEPPAAAQAGPKVLAEVELFKDMPPGELSELETFARFKRFPAGAQIFDRQSETNDVFFVIRGGVRVVNYSVSGREITLDDILQGGHFGELAAIDGQPRSASVMAITESLIVALPARIFITAMKRNPNMALGVMRDLVRVIRLSTERIMDLSTLGANNRVHADLLRQARANMTGDNQAEIDPIPIHGDIASRVSTTRETVARVMNELARQGIIERKKNVLAIHDVNNLQGVVEEVRGE